VDAWTFALDVYRRPGIDAACLDLQDRRGADVVLLVVALWAGAVCAHAFTRDEADRLEAAARPWREEVVRPLRAVRRRLKAGPAPAPSAAAEALRGRVKDAELAAERLQLEHLAALTGLSPAPARSREAAARNLRLLLREEDEADRLGILALVNAAAP
jgi:uncharacterized protein (TIGR02444 family)